MLLVPRRSLGAAASTQLLVRRSLGTVASTKASLAWQDLSKKLPLRAVLFDASVILRSADEADAPSSAAKLKQPKIELRRPEELLKEGRIKDMLQREMREELIRRGLSPIGKPWELRARLHAVLEAEAVGIRQSPDSAVAAPPAPPSSPSPSEAVASAAAPVDGAEGGSSGGGGGSSTGPAATPDFASASSEAKRAAYAAKLRARTGASMLPGGRIAAPATGPTPGALPDNVRPPGTEVTFGGATWSLQPGTRELLTYLDMRGMMRLVMPSAGVESDEAAGQQAAQLAHTMRVPPFHHILSLDDAAACRRAEPEPLARLRDALMLPTSTELMVVSSDGGVLKAAKKASSFSCYFFRRLPGAPSRCPSDFHADDMAGVRHAVEDLNGITFRDPSTEIRTQYGVSTT